MEEQTSGKPTLGEKATKAKDAAVGKAQGGISTVKDTAAKVKEKAVAAKEALSAFADEAKKQDLQGSVKEAMGTMGSAAREVGQTAKGEMEQTKESARSGPGSPSS